MGVAPAKCLNVGRDDRWPTAPTPCRLLPCRPAGCCSRHACILGMFAHCVLLPPHRGKRPMTRQNRSFFPSRRVPDPMPKHGVGCTQNLNGFPQEKITSPALPHPRFRPPGMAPDSRPGVGFGTLFCDAQRWRIQASEGTGPGLLTGPGRGRCVTQCRGREGGYSSRVTGTEGGCGQRGHHCSYNRTPSAGGGVGSEVPRDRALTVGGTPGVRQLPSPAGAHLPAPAAALPANVPRPRRALSRSVDRCRPMAFLFIYR